MGAGYQRMLPRLDDLNRFYWTSGEDGVLRMLRCQDCSLWVHPPQPVCPKCLTKHLAPEPLSGRGTVFSYTVNEKAWGPGLEVPYVIGVVRLDEQDGLQLTTNICVIASDQVHIGMRVRVTFDHDEDIWLPMFEPEAMRNAA
ncbi:MAG: DNA-binding protein [Sphingobium sp.]|nr:MAG: DNA-binding protein [Sphingobium sp.]